MSRTDSPVAPCAMRVALITESHEARAGGITTVVHQLAREMGSQGVGVEIVSVGEDPLPAPPGVRLTNSVPASFSGPWKWSWKLKHDIQTAALNDGASVIFHLHGIWLASQWYGARIGSQKEIPTILSAHGQLEPYHWTDRGTLHLVKKRLYWRLVAHPAFRSLRAIHAITPHEADNQRALFKDKAISLIPN